MFPGLSRTEAIFRDFPGPGIFKKKIQDFRGGVGTLTDGLAVQQADITLQPAFILTTMFHPTEIVPSVESVQCN